MINEIEKIQKRFFGTYLVLISAFWLTDSVSFCVEWFFSSSFYVATVLFLIQCFSLGTLLLTDFYLVKRFLPLYCAGCTICFFPGLVADMLQHRYEIFLFQVINCYSLTIIYRDKRLFYWIVFILLQVVVGFLVILTFGDDTLHSLLLNYENRLFYFSFDFYRHYEFIVFIFSSVCLFVTLCLIQLLKAEKESDPCTLPEKKLKSDEEMYHLLYEQIVRYFDENKPYTSPNFKIGELAVSLKTNPRNVSQAIRQNRQMNFNTFCNNYRINLAKKLLEGEEGRKYTIQHIYMVSGFQIQSTFNHVFRQITGFSPSEYLAHLKG